MKKNVIICDKKSAMWLRNNNLQNTKIQSKTLN